MLQQNAANELSNERKTMQRLNVSERVSIPTFHTPRHQMKKIKRLFDGMPRRTLFNTGTLLIGGLLFSAAFAFADGQNNTQTVVGSDIIMPYDGYLMIDSAPITGIRTIKFDLYQDATGGNVVWTETQTVNLYNGRFSVGLGSGTSLTSTILDAEKLYLAMTIVETDAQGNAVEIALAGRQAIEPAPFAAWSANSADFNVAGALTVAGNAQVNTLGVTGAATVGSTLGVSGKATLDSAEVTNNFEVKGQTNLGNGYTADRTYITGVDNNGTTAALIIDSDNGAQKLLVDGAEIDTLHNGGLFLQNNVDTDVNVMSDLTVDGMIKPGYVTWDGTDVGDGLAAIANDNNVYKALMVVGNNSATGNDRQIKMYDDVIINKELTAPDINVTDDLTVTDDVVAGNVYYQPDCPGSPTLEISNTSRRARMCVYTVGGGSNSDQDGTAARCWNNHGAQLCTVAQMHIAVSKGLSLTTNLWLADRTNDDEAILTNRTGTYNYNFDTTANPTSNFDGGYCCIVLHGQ